MLLSDAHSIFAAVAAMDHRLVDFYTTGRQSISCTGRHESMNVVMHKVYGMTGACEIQKFVQKTQHGCKA